MSFTYPGASVDFTLTGFVNLSACDVLKNFCGGDADTSAFDSFELDYAVQVKSQYSTGSWESISSHPNFSLSADQPPKLIISGSTQLAAYYDGQIEFRLCADGISPCSKQSLFSINYIDTCSSFFKWGSSTISLDQPTKAVSRPANIFDVIVKRSSTGTLTFIFNHESHADCGTKSVQMVMSSDDGQHTAYYTMDENSATFTLDFDATR